MKKYTKTILVFTYYILFSLLIYVPLILLNINIDKMSDNDLYIYTVITQIILISSLLFIYRKDMKVYFDDFKKNGKEHLKKGLKYWIIGLSIMITSNLLISILSPIKLAENEQSIRKVLEVVPLFIAFAAVIEAPIVEELLFRKSLFDVFSNKKIFVIVSGLLFGAFHIIGSATSIYSWLYIIPYAALGMSFAYAYVKTNNVITSICLHALHNFITLLILFI